MGEGLSATRFFTFGGSTIATETVTSGGGAPPASWALLLGDGQGSAQVSMALKPDATAVTGLAPASASDEVLRNAYEPYGAVRGGDHLVTSRGWLGQVSDADTGLVYLNARYYDPALGRFLSPDPLFNPASPKTLDPYRYADNNPVMFSDATGLTPCAGTGANEQRCLDSYNRGMRHSKTKPKWDLSPRNIVKAYGRLLWGVAGVVTPVPSVIGGVKTLIDFVKDPGKTWDSNWAAKKQALSDGWTAYKSGWGLWTGGSPRDFWHNVTHSPWTNYVGVSWDNKDLGGMAQTTGTGIGVVGTIALTAGLGGIGAGEGLASAAAEEEAAAGAANTETTTLFRSVGPGEASDIASTGTFNNTAGINVKYFATNAEDAVTWGKFLNPGESTIVCTRVPTWALDGAMFAPRWDGIGPAWILDEAQLASLNQAMDGISVVP